MNAPHRFSVAPMMDWTDRHCRYFLRLISRRALLYTEMVTTGALLHGDVPRHLDFSPEEHPVALQLGGSSPNDLASCTRLATEFGYDEVNLNVGCPSDRVQNGRFGACLMAEPELVGECVAAMRSATTLPVTVKTRLGIDDFDQYEFLVHLIECIRDAGCRTVILHARKAWLQGLSPKENRTIPPIDYSRVYRLKRDFPELEVIINGEIHSIDHILEHLKYIDGVMVGRAAYHDPYFLSEVDARVYDDISLATPTRIDILHAYVPYIEAQLALGVPLSRLTKPILGLFKGVAGGAQWRRYLSENVHKNPLDINVILESLKIVA